MAKKRRKGRRKVRTKEEKRLRSSLNYYKNKYYNSLDVRKAYGLQNDKILDLGTNYDLFGDLSFKKIFEEGITRKEKGKTIRYTGKQAVKLTIKSLKAETDRSSLKQRFIDNYTNAMRDVGVSEGKVRYIKGRLNKLTPEQMADITQKDILPEISYIYTNKDDGGISQSQEDALIDRIKEVLNSPGLPSAEEGKAKLKIAKGKAKLIKELMR